MNLAEIRTTKMFLTLLPDLDHASGGSFNTFIFEFNSLWKSKGVFLFHNNNL